MTLDASTRRIVRFPTSSGSYKAYARNGHKKESLHGFPHGSSNISQLATISTLDLSSVPQYLSENDPQSCE